MPATVHRDHNKRYHAATGATHSMRTGQLRTIRKLGKWIALFTAGVYFIPKIFIVFVVCGLIDVLRNTEKNVATMRRYFLGNGVLTWILSPFNLLMDVLCLPYRNRGIYALSDLPDAYQAEITDLIKTAEKIDLSDLAAIPMNDRNRAMLFFKWYGKNVNASISVPEFHRDYKFVRTIGLSVFNKHQSTSTHFGPLRVTLRVLYCIGTVSDAAYISVGDQTHYWSEDRLFVFDDTLQHRSYNQSDSVRYCLFVDILRPSFCPWLIGFVLLILQKCISPLNALFYKNWNSLKETALVETAADVLKADKLPANVTKK